MHAGISHRAIANFLAGNHERNEDGIFPLYTHKLFSLFISLAVTEIVPRHDVVMYNRSFRSIRRTDYITKNVTIHSIFEVPVSKNIYGCRDNVYIFLYNKIDSI